MALALLASPPLQLAREMNAVALLPLLVLLAVPAYAGFAAPQQVQTVKLGYGQNTVAVAFQTADGSRITKARALCDCTSLSLEGTRLVATVDTSTFDAPVDKQVEVTTSDGQQATLTMRFEVPQAVIINTPALVWERNSPPTTQEFRLRLPKGSPVRALLSADLSGDDFNYSTRTISPGREYAIAVTPKSTARRRLNRLVIRMDGPDPRYMQRILYLRVK